MTLFKKFCFLYLKLLWNKTLAYINQSYNQGFDIKSQKPGSSGMKPGTVCSYLLGFACLLGEAGKTTLTCRHWKKIKNKFTLLHILLSSSLQLFFSFCPTYSAILIALMNLSFLTVLLQGWKLVPCYVNYAFILYLFLRTHIYIWALTEFHFQEYLK